jgi:heme oxygenase
MSLKELTKDLHTEAENTEFAKRMMQGELTLEEYVNYLYQLILVYQPIELGCNLLGILDELPGLERTPRLLEDYRELEKQVQSHKLYWVPSTITYHNHLLELTRDSNKRHLIKAHMYVRHMGDLFGGQMIVKRVPGSGKFYRFENSEELKKNIRTHLTDDLGDEARLAFEWNIKIMKELHESSLANSN